MGDNSRGIWNLRRRTGSVDVPNPGDVRPDTPVPERVRGTVFAYRGMEQHGVPVEQPVIPLDDEVDVDEYPVDEDLPPISPIPVYIVNRSGDERRTIKTAQFPIGTTATRIANRNDGRTRMRIKNIETTATFLVWIGGDNNISSASFDGYPLIGGESIEVMSEDEVWCVSDGQGAAGFNRVAVLYENTVNLG